jgi:alkylhydroperoxidase family enzyme
LLKLPANRTSRLRSSPCSAGSGRPRECPYYTERERAALAWAEAVTLITDGHVPEPLFEEVRSHFSETELSDLTLAVATINAWNRPSISARLVPGAYQPAKRPEVMKGA